jgi:hypothetical protein
MWWELKSIVDDAVRLAGVKEELVHRKTGRSFVSRRPNEN